MAMTMLEKILSFHSKHNIVQPGNIIDVDIDVRCARDFGGANVVKKIRDFRLKIDDPAKTFFTFDCNPTGSDQKYALNQQICRIFARETGIRVFDIDAGIGTHLLIDNGSVFPGCTAISTDSHANLLGAVGAFGQGMGDMDIAAAWNKGKIWFKVPESVRIILKGERPPDISAKDIALNLLGHFGANSLLGYSIEIYGNAANDLILDERITISSMATEMGAIIILFPPSDEISAYCKLASGNDFNPVYADTDALYSNTFEIGIEDFVPLVSLPGEPHNTVSVSKTEGLKIDSAFIGSCTNGRMSDMERAAKILSGRKVAPGVVLKIVPSTDFIWKRCLETGIIDIFKKAGALVSNAGCAGCAAGQVGQNGPGEVTISTGNRNFPGKQGNGSVYLASPETVAASAVAGYITTSGRIPAEPAVFTAETAHAGIVTEKTITEIRAEKPLIVSGRVWLIMKDNIDTDMIFHNRYLTVTNITEMGQYTFDNLKGYEDFARKVLRGDIIITGKNFGAGSSRQQAVDCFISLGIQAVIAESFGAIYERNAINAGFPVVICKNVQDLSLKDGESIRINFSTGEIENLITKKSIYAQPFSEVQSDIYINGGLLFK